MATINGLRLYPEGAISAMASAIRVRTNTYTISQIASGITDFSTGFGLGDYSVLYSIMNRNFSGTFSNSNVSTVKAYAFYKCSGGGAITFPSISFANVKTIGSYAFAQISWLQYVSLPEVETIGVGAFYSNYRLRDISLPKCKYIQQSAFGFCSSYFTDISIPMCLEVGSSAFYGCYKLNKILLPSASIIQPYAFLYCSSLSILSAPLVQSIGQTAFASTSLTSVLLPSCSYLGGWAFQSCVNLQTVDLPIFSSYLGNGIFSGCWRLTSLYLRYSSSVIKLSNINVFTSTPLYNYSSVAGGWGKIYVPNALLNSYKAATNWVTISNMIYGI